ncbi:hypothetical protein [Marinimicrobium sp. LS-A18]|uniref:hypothetical protein n=1 Tax=Marinimicrobium sp. LS-A18 TaxID=1381596 RepID=UPI000464D475|nr:hypothetical protein [Marinimicrobium sp. LS-A18]
MGTLFAFLIGAFLGVVVTASLYRSRDSRNVCNAIASVQRYLETDDLKPLDKMTGKLKLHLDLINEADELVVRSEWARQQKNRFVTQAVKIIRLRNKGEAKEQQERLIQAQKGLKQSGQYLLGYFQFPSFLWLRATIARLPMDTRKQVAALRTS